ncbi:HIT family protein [Microbispora cellulosiformans]|uniref:HIT family protein n=1 Tax=Microbispora cellulosiformans TaxID=2614688 RepID=A0A5J5KB85_9ACTN|nr:HIT family protein [Microbispora cellulosiformans]
MGAGAGAGAGDVDGELVASRTANVFVLPVPSQRAKNLGHCLVLPTAHVTSLHTAPRDLLAELFDVVGQVTAAVREAFGAPGSMVLQNDNIPGQTLSHLHVPVIPRSPDDGFILSDPGKIEIPFEVRAQQAAQLRKALSKRSSRDLKS